MDSKDFFQIAVPLVKALRHSSAKVSFANDFDDFLAQPDKPAPEVFKGARGYFELLGEAVGKRHFLDVLSTKQGKKTRFLFEFLKLFNGAEFASVVSFSPDSIAGSLKFNDMLEEVSTPAGLKELSG